MPSIRTVDPGPTPALAQRRVAGAEVAESSAFLEADGVGQFDQIALRCSEIFAETAVGVGVEQSLAVRAEGEVPHEGVAIAVLVFTPAAGAAAPQESPGLT